VQNIRVNNNVPRSHNTAADNNTWLVGMVPEAQLGNFAFLRASYLLLTHSRAMKAMANLGWMHCGNRPKLGNFTTNKLKMFGT
jgi:hypothetical protein